MKFPSRFLFLGRAEKPSQMKRIDRNGAGIKDAATQRKAAARRGSRMLVAAERLTWRPMVADSNPLKSLPIRFPCGTTTAEWRRVWGANSE
jgi:hypothetical protein